MTDYLTSADLKNTLELTGETFADDDIALAITSASRAIDNVCNRRFFLDADDTSVRYYTPRSRRLLEIDDAVVVASVMIDTDGDGTFDFTWTENTDYVLEPLNSEIDGEPYTAIRRRKTGHYQFPVGVERGVKITGQFGWADVPSEVTSAAGILAGRLMRRAREAPFGVIGFGMDSSNAVQLARNDPDVMMLVGPYVKRLML